VVAKREPRAETRRRILEAAASVFAKNGIDATSLETIAVAAGLTKGAIFSNFESKTALVIAVAEEYRSQLDFSMFLDPALSFEQQFPEFGRVTAKALRGTQRRQVLLDRALQTHYLKNAAARARQRKTLSEAAKAGGAWLDALAAYRGVRLPLPGEHLVNLLAALARGLMEAALYDPSLLEEDYFADAFGVIARSIESVDPR